MRSISVALVGFWAAAVAIGCGSDSDPVRVASSPTEPSPSVSSAPPKPTPAPPSVSSAPSPEPTLEPVSQLPVYWLAGLGSREGASSCACPEGGLCGGAGVIARSDDFGDTWRRTYVDAPLVSADFATRQNGWAVSKELDLLQTFDGGETWVRKTDGIELPEQSYPRGMSFSKVRFFDDLRGVIAGVGVTDEVGTFFAGVVGYRSEVFVLSTQDGGNSWHPVSITRSPVAPANYVDSICVTTSGIGLIGTGLGALLTRDGGLTWENTHDRLGSYWGVGCHGEQTLWLLNAPGSLRSSDGGDTWELIREGSLFNFRVTPSMEFVTETRGWIAGDDQLLRTDDGGRTWSAVEADLPPGFTPWRVEFVTSRDGLWAGNGFVGVSHDAGETWNTVDAVPADEGGFCLLDIAVFGLEG